MKAPVGSLTHLLTAQDDFDPRFDYSFEVKKISMKNKQSQRKLKGKKLLTFCVHAEWLVYNNKQV